MNALTLMGLGDRQSEIDAEITGFLQRAPNPSSTAIADFLKLYSGDERTRIAQQLTARGVNPTATANALTWLDTQGKWLANWPKISSYLALASGAVSAFHGYRRNKSIGWGAVWFVLGTIFPIVTPVIALAQGYGKAKS